MKVNSYSIFITI